MGNFATNAYKADREHDLGKFNRRLGNIFYIGLCLHITLIFLYTFTGTPLAFSVINLVFFTTSAFVYNLIPDKFDYFLVTHQSWMFSFNTYIYAALHGQGVTYGLYDPIITPLIGLTFHFGVLVAFLLVRLLRGSNSLRMTHARNRNNELTALPQAKLWLIILGLGGYWIAALFPFPTVLAASGMLEILLWVGLGLHIIEKGRPQLDRVIIFVLVNLTIVSLETNARHYILSIIVFSAIAYLMYARKVINLKLLIPVYLLVHFLSVFSSITLDIRINSDPREARDLLAVYSEKVFSLDTAAALIIPFYESESARNIRETRDERYDQDFFKSPFFTYDSGLATRFVVMPQADIVCGQLGTITNIKWDEIIGLVVSALPNIEVEKSLIYSDRLTWDLGLRSIGNIGYPMITAACEFYSMGGFIICFLLATITMFGMFWWCEVLKKAFVRRELYYLVLPQVLLFVVITSTGLSVVASVIRVLPFVFVLLYILSRFSRGPKTRLKRNISA